MDIKLRTKKIIRILKKTYPKAKSSLNFKNQFEMLISTILSAQCTDKRVNIVTSELFKKYKKPADFARLKQKVLEKEIKSVGLYHSKAKSIIGCCKMLIEKYNGKVPSALEELIKLPGVGRKTANVVLGNAFGIPAIAVDTHVTRLSKRIGFSKLTDAGKIEFDLMKIVPKSEWTLFSHLLIFHGRAVCKAGKPLCGKCVLAPLCPKIGVTR